MSSSVNRVPLEDHPLDIQHYIIEMIDSAEDLLALALTSKRYRDFIIPFHIQFRSLSCPLASGVWEPFAMNRHFCKRFRNLEFLFPRHYDHCDPTIPRCLLSQLITQPKHLTEETAEYMRVVSQSMESLLSFKWIAARFSPPEDDSFNIIFGGIVQSCPSLSVVWAWMSPNDMKKYFPVRYPFLRESTF